MTAYVLRLLPVVEALDLEGSVQVSLALSTAAAQTDPLAAGIYDMWADVDCFVRIGPVANGVLPVNGYMLRAGNTVPVLVREGSRIGAVVASGAGTLRYHLTGTQG